jgi:hypothetical protein
LHSTNNTTIHDSQLFFLKKIVITFLLIIIQFHITAQTKDTLSFYKKIKKVAYKHRFTTLIYQEIFVEPVDEKPEDKPLPSTSIQQKADPNQKYAGKIIRKIKIDVYDPFGYSANDTSKKEINKLQQLGNKYHMHSRHRIIQNLLLFRQNDEVELFKINESERLLREASYINDSRIYINKVPNSKDSVDVIVVVHDKWELDGNFSGNIYNGGITLRDRNIFGTGQTYQQGATYSPSSHQYQFDGNYSIGNYKKTFISSSFFYLTTKDVTSMGVSLNRPFYSTLAKWAGGITEIKTWGVYKYRDSIERADKIVPLNNFNSDVWIAKNFNPSTKKDNGKNINYTIALRYATNFFQNRPSFTIDSAKSNLNTSLYLASAGISLLKYYKDKFIYRFGANEDIPEGLVIQILYGIVLKEQNEKKYYSGIDISKGKHYERLGYLSCNMAYGALYNKSSHNNAVINAGVYYFSNLLEIKHWYYRQFINFKLIDGINKDSTEKITLRTDEMYGFKSGTLSGTKKMILNLEAVTYAPYNIIGFRFAPLILIGCGLLETTRIKFLKSPVYQSYAVGLLIRNENLLNASFEITYGFYPNLPDSNKKYYNFNPSISFTLKVRSFAISKPAMVAYD